MATGKMIFTSQKETFVVRVLMKKLQDAGIECSFVPLKVDELHDVLADCKLAAVYIEDDIEARDDVIQ